MMKRYYDILIMFTICLAIAGIVVSLLIGEAYGRINEPDDPESWDAPIRYVWQIGKQDEAECALRGGCLVVTADAIQALITQLRGCGQRM
jgi:hypothetical protein